MTAAPPATTAAAAAARNDGTGLRGRILIIGAGLTGAVIGRTLAEAGYGVTIFDQRPYPAGNCHTERDAETGIMVHVHGPHIFHTDNQPVWDYVNRFATFHPYITQVKATTGGRVYGLPINLLTINQFFGKTFSPAEAQAFIASLADPAREVRSFEDQALAFLGPDLYEAFFKGYPIKQWGLHPRELPASVLKRLPVRFDYNDNYFNHRHQGIPVEGYTVMVERILDHPRIAVTLDRPATEADMAGFDHTFYSGPLDAWLGYRFGQLGYRTLDFQASRHDGDFQGCAVMSYPEEAVPFTRITEHKHFTPWERHHRTIVFHEYSRLAAKGDIPYYPIRLLDEKAMLRQYVDYASTLQGISFVGRLGTYKYMDMDVTVAEAMDAAAAFLAAQDQGTAVPAFFSSPL